VLQWRGSERENRRRRVVRSSSIRILVICHALLLALAAGLASLALANPYAPLRSLQVGTLAPAPMDEAGRLRAGRPAS
jgi:hypothetical protein